MNFSLQKKILTYCGTELTVSEKLFLSALASFGDESGENISPSLSELAKRASLWKSQVITLLKSLLEKNFIVKAIRRKTFGTNLTNHYFINLKKLINLGKKVISIIPKSQEKTNEEKEVNRKQSLGAVFKKLFKRISGPSKLKYRQRYATLTGQSP
jgi:hypothetical protein